MVRQSSVKSRKGVKETITKEDLLSSMLKVSRLLTRPVSIDVVLNAIVKETRKFFGLNRVAIFLVNKEPRLLECKYLIGFDKEEVGRALTIPLHLDKHRCRETLVATTGETMFVKDRFHDPRITETDLKMDLFWRRVSTITAPLRIKRDIIGVLEGDRTDKPLNLSKNEINLFTFFANQASIIIENARLQSQNQKKIEQFLLLQETTKKSSSTFEIDYLIDIISSNALKLTRANSCLLFLVGKEGQHLKVISSKGKAPHVKPVIAIGEGIVGEVAATGKPRLIYDIRKEGRSDGEDPSLISQLAVPMISEKKVLGVISMYHNRISAFDADDLEILSILASHAAVLIQNAHLYEQVLTERDLAGNILESSPQGVMTIDIGGYIQSINRKAEQILDINRNWMLGKTISQIKDDRIEEILNAAFDEEPRHGVIERILTRKNDDVAILEIATSFVKRLNGKRSGIIITFKDVTESKKTDEILRRMDRMMSLGQLSAGIAHEIRNPLASITFNIEMLSKRTPQDDDSTELFDETLVGVNRIKAIVKNILDFAKPAFPQFKLGRIEQVISRCAYLMKSQLKKKKISVDSRMEEELPEIVFDDQQIGQVFINLILNAMDAMPDGGRIIINARKSLDETGMTYSLVVSISDTGMGISPKHLPRIFDPFFTTKPEGTGLGLSIVHKILEQHDASINVTSELNQGTTFVLKFPLLDNMRKYVSVQTSDR
jgi:two-component system NtrC family sensor kinase